MSAHYDIPTKGKSKNFAEEITTKLNSGIAIITPAEHIRELLMREDVVADREKRDANVRRQRPVATADFAKLDDDEQMTLAPNPKDRIKIPVITRGQFFNDLTKATRKRKKK